MNFQNTAENAPGAAPGAPWDLEGDAIALMEGWRSVRLLVDYSASPVGPYLENAVAVLTWGGPHVEFMGVTSATSVAGGRGNWGFPKVLQKLSRVAGEPARHEAPGIHWRFATMRRMYHVRATRVAFPFAAAFWCWQWHGAQKVRVPAHIRGTLRLGFRGKQAVAILEKFHLTVEKPVAL